MLKRAFTLTLALGALALAQLSQAYSLVSSTAGMYGQSLTNYWGTNTFSGYTGAQSLTFTAGGGGTPAGYPTTFIGYCVGLEDVFVNPQNVTLRSTNELTKNGISPNSGVKVAWLYNTFGSSISSNVQGAALQAAIWEALYDSSVNLSSGFYHIDTSQTAVLNQANSYLNAMQLNFTSNTGATWFDAPVGQGQDIVGPLAVPEPGLMGLVASASMSGLYLLRRRRVRK